MGLMAARHPRPSRLPKNRATPAGRNVFVEVGYRYMCVDDESSDFLYRVNSCGAVAGIGFKL
jgi:hypothetical protein